VAEVTAAAKPAIFVPFPRAADDHQKRNAEALQRAGAAVMLEQSNLTRESLVQTVISLFADQARLKAMGEAARRLSHPDAAREIAMMAAQVAGIKD
jgi:UDP-N-acetylglucosamine--N-acetylmuramyl-(pentapeptide) pyrophosphoryl-undecaprenol N-acetylglucosamine transferase